MDSKVEAAEKLSTLLHTLVTYLVDDEDTISITYATDEEEHSVIRFTVDVAKSDVGNLIGRSGKTAGALRHFLGSASAKLKVRSMLYILDKKGE